MKVYVLRHAEAIEGNGDIPDEWRCLTEKGRKITGTVAKRLARRGLKSCLVMSSPLVRSVQTAQVLAEKIGRKCRVEISGLLLPGGETDDLVELLHAMEDLDSIMLVGHEPRLGELVAALLRHEESIQLKKLGCVELEINPAKQDKPAKFVSYLVPGRKIVTSLKKAFALPVK